MSRSHRFQWLASVRARTQTRQSERRSAPVNASRQRKLHCELLEDRRMLAGIVVSNNLDVVNGVTTSLAALIASPGADGISLREAVRAANQTAGEDVITFAPAIVGSTISLTGGELAITDALTIDASGPGAGVTIDAKSQSRIFNVDDSNANQINVNMFKLTLMGGNTSGDGGAIRNAELLLVANSTIKGNQARNGGGIVNYGILTVRDSTVNGNLASAEGGGIWSDTDLNGKTTRILRSTISTNTASVRGGGIRNYDGFTDISYSTITNNSAPAGAGSGISTYGDNATFTSVRNSIIAGNVHSDVDFTEQPVNSYQSDEYNLIGSGNALAAFNKPGDRTGVADPRLGPLANNGGPTWTHALLADSPAINVGNPALQNSGSQPFDQRGTPFVRVFGGRIDIGAYEATNDVFAWASPADGVLTLAGTIWQTAAADTNQQWRVLVDSDAITEGTLLTGQFTAASPLSIAFGAGGPAAVRNISVKAGELIRVLVTGGKLGDAVANVTASFHAGATEHYELGALPTRFTSNGKPLEFIVDRPAGWTGPFTVQAIQTPTGTLDIDPTTGRFRYTPAAADRFDFDVLFQIGDGGTFEAPRRQLVTISPSEIAAETGFVSEPGPMPNAASLDYITVSESVGVVPSFNAVEFAVTRNVEISGKTVYLTPGHANGLFERIAYTGQATNRNVQSIKIYAETLVIGGALRLPQTAVTIYARTIEFIDAPGVTASINTTPLDYASAAFQFFPGRKGEDGGNITLHVETLLEPAGSTMARFILNGANGQTAGAGLAGAPGLSQPIQEVPSILLWPSPYNSNYPPFTVPPPNLVYIQGERDSFEVKEPSTGLVWPADGGNAIPGGSPGAGGSGGKLTVYGPSLRLDSFSAARGLAGGKAANQPGGSPGTPVNSTSWEGFKAFYPTWISHGVVTTHTAVPGADWIAPAGADGSAGSVELKPPTTIDWLHPAALRAMVSYAKDAYINGRTEFAAQAFGEYLRLVEAKDVPPEFADLQSEIALYAHRAASGLDYFGNPPGWTPTLSFAANFQAFQNEIDNDLRLLYLTRFLQNSAASQASLVAGLTKSLANLDADIASAKSALNKAQDSLPALEGELDVINADTLLIKQMLQAKEIELLKEARDTLAAASTTSFWSKALGVMSKVLPLIPEVGEVAGTFAEVGSDLLADSAGSDSFEGVDDDYNDKLADAQQQLAALRMVASPATNSSTAAIQGYRNTQAPVKDSVADIAEALKSTLQAVLVPKSKLEQELARIKAQDARFNELVAEIEKLNAKKEAFAQNLADAVQTIAKSLQRIAEDYAAADAFNAQKIQISGGLRHDVLDYVKQLERQAKERLLRYQYYMAKAYEYELLQPYTGNFQLANVLNAIQNLVANHPADANWLDNPTNFAALKSIYEAELRSTADQIWTQLNTNAPQRTSQIAPRLSSAQLAELNLRGEITINLVDMGFIPADRQDVKILDMGVQQITATMPGANAQLANVRFAFEHSGTSVVQSGGAKYLFQHHSTDDATTFFWATDYDAISKGLVQSEISPSQIASITTLLGLSPASVSSDQASRLYAHPGAWADITIRKTETLVPTTVDVDVTDLQFFVKFEADQPLTGTALIDVRAGEGLAPRIDVSRQDRSGHDDGVGSFTRIISQNLGSVTLIAEPTHGRFKFDRWRDAAGQTLSASPSLTLPLTQNRQVFVVYVPNAVAVLPGDYDGSGNVSGNDFLLWQRRLGSPAAPAGSGADGNQNGVVDAGDLAVWRTNFRAGATSAAAVSAGGTDTSTFLADVAASAIAAQPVWKPLTGHRTPAKYRAQLVRERIFASYNAARSEAPRAPSSWQHASEHEADILQPAASAAEELAVADVAFETPFAAVL